MCGFNCSECAFPDCICDEKPTPDELEASNALDFEVRKENARISGKAALFKYNHSEKGQNRLKKYNHSEKGHKRLQKYNQSEKGKARLQRYYESEKGKENERRKVERRKMARLQQKGGSNEG